MDEFENIESIWNKQQEKEMIPAEVLIKKAKKITKEIRIKHQWTQAILLVTVSVLIVFFIKVTAYNFTQSFLGAFLMVSSLLARISLEYISERRFKKLDVTVIFQNYVAKMEKFYYWRKRVHSIYTPLILITYATGFILLLPYFKKGLSEGFYTYVWISGIVLLFIFSYFIYKQIQQELSNLNFLKNLNENN